MTSSLSFSRQILFHVDNLDANAYLGIQPGVLHIIFVFAGLM